MDKYIVFSAIDALKGNRRGQRMGGGWGKEMATVWIILYE